MQDIISQEIIFDEKGQGLATKFSDGSVKYEPLTSEQAAEWEAEHKF